MKKLLALSVLIAAISVPVFADAVFQLDVGAGVSYSFDIIPFPDANLQLAWYSPNSGVGGGFHAKATIAIIGSYNGSFVEGWPLPLLGIGGDFVWASRSNKGLWNIGAGLTIPWGFHVTTGYQWAFGNGRHRFALKPSISVDILPFGFLNVIYGVSLSLNYSFNNAQTHGR
jgi:hypothetical protein